MKKLLTIKTSSLYFLISVVSFIPLALSTYIFTEFDLLLQLYGNELSHNELKNILDFNIKYFWIVFLIEPVIILIQVIVPTFFIHMVLVFKDIDIKFSEVFHISLLTRFTYFVLESIQLILFYFTDFASKNLDIFYEIPLSASKLFNKNLISFPLYVLLKKINIFELIYIYILAAGLQHFTNLSKKKSFKLSIFIWTLFICFSIVIQSFLHLTMK